MQQLGKPQDIAPIPKDIKGPRTIMTGNMPKKLTDQGKDEPVES